MRALADMPEDQHRELAAWVDEMNQQTRAASTRAATDDGEAVAQYDEPLLDFEAEFAKG